MLIAPFAAGMVNFSADLGQGVANGFASWEQGKIGDGFKAIASGLANGLKDGLSAFATKLVPLLQAAQTIQGRPLRAPSIATVLNAQSHYILTLPREMRLTLMNSGYQFIQVVQHCESFVFKSTFRSDSILLAQSEFAPLDVPVKSCYIGQAVNTYSIKILKTKDGSPEECQDSVVPDKTNLNVGTFSKTIDQCKGIAPAVNPEPLPNPTIDPSTPQLTQLPCGVNADGSLKEGISDTFNYGPNGGFSTELGEFGTKEFCLVSPNKQHFVKYEFQPSPDFSIINFNGTATQIANNFKANRIIFGFRSIYFDDSAKRIAKTKDWSERHCFDRPPCVPPP
ncbi:hypothetical protein BKA69DRAFT_1097998, partial [Paraphysoderma sedebokerense]